MHVVVASLWSGCRQDGDRLTPRRRVWEKVEKFMSERERGRGRKRGREKEGSSLTRWWRREGSEEAEHVNPQAVSSSRGHLQSQPQSILCELVSCSSMIWISILNLSKSYNWGIENGCSQMAFCQVFWKQYARGSNDIDATFTN